MSELTKEKIYKKELIKAGATGNNNLERIRSLAGGGGSQALDDLLTGQLTTLESNVSGEIVGLYGNNITTISFPNATSIGISAFQEWEELTSVTLPNVTTIGDYAFNGCISLVSLVLPKVTSIGDNVFQAANSLTSLTLGANQVCSIGTFGNSENTITVYVPSDLIEQYKVAPNWSTAFNNNQVTFVAITE